MNLFEDVEKIMQDRFGVVPKLTFTDNPFSETNFCLKYSLPYNLMDFSLIKKYYNEKIKIPEKFNIYMHNIFTMYVDQISRFDAFYQASYHDYLNYFNILSNFLYKYIIKENIEIVYFSNFPHMGVDWVLYNVAKYLGIKTFFIAQDTEKETNIPVLVYAKELNFDNLYQNMNRKLRTSELVIPQVYEKNLWYMRNIKKFTYKNYLPDLSIKDKIKLLRHIIFNNFNKYILFSFVNKINRYKKAKETVETRMKHITNEVNYDCNYVYFGLHLQPEATTSFSGGILYSDQLLAIEKLRNLLPSDWKIYVKENPKQTEFERYRLFYERLCLMDNVVLVPDETSTYDLIKHAKFVSSIIGTLIYEAVSGGKPAVMFGSYWYERIPGVFKYNDNLALDDILNCKINHSELQQIARDFYSCCMDGVTERSYAQKEGFNKDKNNENIVKLLSMALD